MAKHSSYLFSEPNLIMFLIAPEEEFAPRLRLLMTTSPANFPRLTMPSTIRDTLLKITEKASSSLEEHVEKI